MDQNHTNQPDVKSQDMPPMVPLYKIGGHPVKWMYECGFCGRKKSVRKTSVDAGQTKSCGCYNRKKATKHGLVGTRVYKAWASAKARCNNPTDEAYRNYGARGIECRFISAKELFDDIGECPKGLSLDRIDNSGHYEKGNVRWATETQQHRNTRRTRNLTINGVTKSVTEWCEIHGINRATAYSRLNKGYSLESTFASYDYSNRMAEPINPTYGPTPVKE